MNRLLYVLTAFVVLNLIFSVIPYVAPRIPAEIVTPYQLWANSLLILFTVLPAAVGSFSFNK